MENLVKVERTTLTMKETVDYLGISYWLVNQLVRRREIPCARVGGRVLFRVQALDEYLKEKEEKHNICELVNTEKTDEIIGEFEYADYMVAQCWIKEIELKKINSLYNMCLKKIDLERYTYIEQEIIKIAMQYITGKKEPSIFDKFISNIDDEILKNVIKNIKNKTRDEVNCVVESLAKSLSMEYFRKCRKM